MRAVNYTLTILCSCFKTLHGAALDVSATFDKSAFDTASLTGVLILQRCVVTPLPLL